MPFSKTGAELLFEVVSRAYERMMVDHGRPIPEGCAVIGMVALATGSDVMGLVHVSPSSPKIMVVSGVRLSLLGSEAFRLDGNSAGMGSRPPTGDMLRGYVKGAYGGANAFRYAHITHAAPTAMGLSTQAPQLATQLHGGSPPGVLQCRVELAACNAGSAPVLCQIVGKLTELAHEVFWPLREPA